jgi:hypothetical protein
MFRRILTAAVTAAALLTAAPVLAEQRDRETDPQKLPPCEHLEMQMLEHRTRTEMPEKKGTSEPDKRAAPPVEEDPFVRNQSWGG